MHLTPVKSSNIRAIGYSPETKTLRIQFASGGIYEYADVAADLHDEMMKAKSVGRFVHENIVAKKCPYRKVPA